MLPTVLLRHDMPDGTHHFDWLFARDAQGSLPLRTWRLAREPHTAAPGDRIPAQPLLDHRPLYLTYEGPISGGRGTVRRIAEASYVPVGEWSNGWIVKVQWDDGRTQTWRLDDVAAVRVVEPPESTNV